MTWMPNVTTGKSAYLQLMSDSVLLYGHTMNPVSIVVHESVINRNINEAVGQGQLGGAAPYSRGLIYPVGGTPENSNRTNALHTLIRTATGSGLAFGTQ